MAQPKPWVVSDELWAVIELLLPRRERRYRHPGRERIDDRKTLQGVLFVLCARVQWVFLPQEPGFGSGPSPRHRGRRAQSPVPHAAPGCSGLRLGGVPRLFLGVVR